MDEGIGEAAAVPQYHESQVGIMSYLDGVVDQINEQTDPFQIESILAGLPPGSLAARAAIDLALHDAWGKRLGSPLYRLFGLDPTRLPETSFTIAIDTPEIMAERAAAANMPVLKIKLGGPNDLAAIAAIRRSTDAQLRVDANCAWTRHQAALLIPRLAEYDLEFVEQPLAAEDLEGFAWLKSQHLGLPIFADESTMSSRDIPRLAGAVDGVVVKLMKAGGMREAVRLIHTARAFEMQVMVSCMVESSLAVTAAAHLAPLCDYADLDGPLLIKNDPFLGITYSGARIHLPELPGLGVIQR
jgi:L-alanine-DL-glutamate epimerase-like enolase superfamily enzyme